jgi:hypothetical protein
VVEVLDQRPQAVAVGRDQHPLAAPHRRRDRLAPVRQEPRHRILQALGEWDVVVRELRVARVVAGVALVVGGERRRTDVVAAAPDLDLGLAKLLGHLRLVEALERAVVALVEPPAPVDRDPHQVHVLEHDPQRLDRAPEDRGVRDVEDVAALVERLRRLVGFLNALLREPDVGPPREPVLLVPDALAVTEQHQLLHRAPAS